MPGWLARSERIRAFDVVAEFLRLSARTPSAEESFPRACELLRQLWDAEAVALWKLDPERRRLHSLAGSSPESEIFGEMDLAAFPDLERALAEPSPVWVEQVATRWHPLPPPLLEAASVLVLPVTVFNYARGCVMGLFGPTASKPLAEEVEAGLTLVHAVGLLLEAETFREHRDRLARQRDTHGRIESDLLRLGLTGAGLQRLAEAARELSHAEATGFYEREPAGFRQLAAAGAGHLLPLELPSGDAAVFPWEESLAEARPLTVPPDQVASALEPWLPQLARTSLRVNVVPLQARGTRLGVLLLCGGRLSADADKEEGNWPGLSLLAAAAMDNRRLLQLYERQQVRYRGLFDHTGEGVFFLDAAGILLTANPTLLRWTGYALPELQDRSLADFLAPEDWEPLCVWLQSGPHQSFHTSLRWRVKAGFWEEFDLVLQAPPPADLPAPILGLARNTTRQRQTDQRLQVSEARLQGLLDSVHDGVWIIGADGRVEFANHRLPQLFGVPPRQLEPGQSHREAVEQLKKQFQAPQKVMQRWIQLSENPDQVCWDEMELARPRRRVLERFSRPLFDNRHQLVGRLEVYRDITSQRVLEDKVLQRERLAALGQLLSGIAHELNNPLTAVAGYAQLLGTANLPADLREKARLLAREAERAGRVVQNLLSFAREAKAEKKAVDLIDVLERTFSLRAYELKVANIRVEREYDATAPPVWGDAHQLQQVFLNLLLNAEQAIRSQREQGRVTARTRAPDAGEAATPNRVRVEISDNGPGIVAAVLAHIFDPFFTTKSSQEGTGLGLSISQAIVKEHGGDMRVESLPGQGATFIVELPAYQPQASAPQLATPRPARAAHRKTRRILVVDDEPAVAHLMADALSQQGYAVRVHTESRRALDEALSQPFHLAICDIRMPEVDGPAFYRTLRDHQSALTRRLLFTTGDTLARETADFLAEVSLPYLAKPFRVEELRTVVRDLLQEFEKPRAGVGGAAPESSLGKEGGD